MKSKISYLLGVCITGLCPSLVLADTGTVVDSEWILTCSDTSTDFFSKGIRIDDSTCKVAGYMNNLSGSGLRLIRLQEPVTHLHPIMRDRFGEGVIPSEDIDEASSFLGGLSWGDDDSRMGLGKVRRYDDLYLVSAVLSTTRNYIHLNEHLNASIDNTVILGAIGELTLEEQIAESEAPKEATPLPVSEEIGTALTSTPISEEIGTLVHELEKFKPHVSSGGFLSYIPVWPWGGGSANSETANLPESTPRDLQKIQYDFLNLISSKGDGLGSEGDESVKEYYSKLQERARSRAKEDIEKTLGKQDCTDIDRGAGVLIYLAFLKESDWALDSKENACDRLLAYFPEAQGKPFFENLYQSVFSSIQGMRDVGRRASLLSKFAPYCKGDDFGVIVTADLETTKEPVKLYDLYNSLIPAAGEKKALQVVVPLIYNTMGKFDDGQKLHLIEEVCQFYPGGSFSTLVGAANQIQSLDERAVALEKIFVCACKTWVDEDGLPAIRGLIEGSDVEKKVERFKEFCSAYKGNNFKPIIELLARIAHPATEVKMGDSMHLGEIITPTDFASTYEGAYSKLIDAMARNGVTSGDYARLQGLMNKIPSETLRSMLQERLKGIQPTDQEH